MVAQFENEGRGYVPPPPRPPALPRSIPFLRTHAQMHAHLSTEALLLPNAMSSVFPVLVC